jgi:hypothetical protein
LLLPSSNLEYEPLSNIDELPSPGRQRSKNTQIFILQFAPCVWPECHKSGDALRIDPVSLCPPAPGADGRHCQVVDVASVHA